jgi:hypothetical protein
MRSIDFVLAYPQAKMKADVFMRTPLGCNINGADRRTHCLKLRKNLDGLKDAGLTWHDHLKAGLLRRGFLQSQVDPCLFTKGSIVLVLYVDDACLLSPSKKAIDDLIKSLSETFTLTDKGDLRDYLERRAY